MHFEGIQSNSVFIISSEWGTYLCIQFTFLGTIHGHVHKCQTPYWTLRKVKKMIFADNFFITSLLPMIFHRLVGIVVCQQIFWSKCKKTAPWQNCDKKLTLLTIDHFMENLKM